MNFKIRIVVFCALLGCAVDTHAQLFDFLKRASNKTTTTSTSSATLTNADYVNGLKEALKVAATSSATSASSTNGFYGNTLIRIAFPEDAAAVREYALKMGLKNQVANFEKRLNLAAELAAKKAEPIFVRAITNMTFTDAISIATGNQNAATVYLRKTSGEELAKQFKPIVAEALASVAITKYWTPLSQSYNKAAPFLLKEPVNTDLEAYVTQKAVDGLFVLVENEEAKIRKEPLKYGSDLLNKIFKTTK